MKSILVLASILITSSANAGLTVGDMSRYSLTTANTAQAIEQSIEVTALNADGTYAIQETTYLNGAVIKQSTVSQSADASTSEESAYDRCPDLGGTIESITVPAGTFQACHITHSANGMTMEMYMGKVLFGTIKTVTTTPAGTNTLQLIAYKKQ